MIWLLVGFLMGGLFLYIFFNPISNYLRRKKEPNEVYKTKYVEKQIYKNNSGYEFARQKILSLQDQLTRHETGVQELHPNDIIRYRAMVEVLTQVLDAR